MCLGIVLICLAGVSTRLPWVLGKVTASIEKPPVAFRSGKRNQRKPPKHCGAKPPGLASELALPSPRAWFKSPDLGNQPWQIQAFEEGLSGRLARLALVKNSFRTCLAPAKQRRGLAPAKHELPKLELELELILTHMTQKPVLRKQAQAVV